MKTKIEYEASDIDFKENRVHQTLSSVVLLILLRMSAMAPPEDKDGSEQFLKTCVAEALTIIEQGGLTITKREEIPAVFRQ